MKQKIHYKKPLFYQRNYYCPYCKKLLTYLWCEKLVLGISLDRWVYCSKCKTHFKISIYGFRERELTLTQNKGSTK